MARKNLSVDLIKDCQRVGNSTLLSWFAENNIDLSKGKSINLFDRIDTAIEDGALTINQLHQAIAEIEENSDKKVFLFRAKNFELLEQKKNSILKEIYKKHGYRVSAQEWVTGKVSTTSTLINFYWGDGFIKLKFGELQYNREVDYETSRFIDNPKPVFIIFVIDTNDGFVQVRLDGPGNIHRHKNTERKSTEAEYEKYYKNLLLQIFPSLNFIELNLTDIVNHISTKELKKFRITKGVTTITNNAKQMFATASAQADVRDLPEYEAAAAKGSEIWLTEDLTGYWVQAESEDALKKDLFMRISQKNSQIRVQRGCLEKELNYGIRQIREIQKAI